MTERFQRLTTVQRDALDVTTVTLYPTIINTDEDNLLNHYNGSVWGYSGGITPLCDLYWENNTSATTITTLGVFELVNSATSTLNPDRTGSWDVPSNGRLRFTGNGTYFGHLGATLATQVGGASREVVAEMWKNGVKIPGSRARYVSDGGDEQSTAIHCMTEITTNDYLELYVSNFTNTANITVVDMNIFAMLARK